MKVLSSKETAEYERLKTRCASLEAALDASRQSTEDANARYDALFEKYSILREKGFVEPISIPAVAPSPTATMPTAVQNELDEFRSDPELYHHNAQWAAGQLAKGADAAVVASTIKYGTHSTVHHGVHETVNG
jgi:hypothetical protein